MSNPTLGEIKSAVAAKGYDTGTSGLVDAINAAVREIVAARRWPFRQKTSTLTATAGSDSVALSGITDLLQVDAVRIDNGVDSYELDWMPEAILRRESNLDRALDIPDFWTRFGDTIRLHPRPNRAYTLQVDYTPEITDLAADADVCVIPRLYMDVVVWGTVAGLAYRERDYASADRAESKRDAAALRMAAAYGIEQRQGGRRVTETGFWDYQA